MKIIHQKKIWRYNFDFKIIVHPKRTFHSSSYFQSNKANKLSIYDLDLKIGEIIEIENHPNSEKLYVEKIQVGEEKPRTIISGLAPYYNKQELNKKKLLVVCNLKHTDIGKLGILSEGEE